MAAIEAGFGAVELDQEPGPLAEEGRACRSVRVARSRVRTVRTEGAGESSRRSRASSRVSMGGVREVSG